MKGGEKMLTYKVRLVVIGRKQTHLRSELEKRGYTLNSDVISRVCNGKRSNYYGIDNERKLKDVIEEIISGWEKEFNSV